ncbi:MAG: hypothetical protein LWW86_12615 [Micrococcales bacterium]|nr:hypothetical protein [Micrococcales bacterium]
MHHGNHFYGHAHIMARYVGLAYPPRIWGYLQHGWNMHDGFAVGTVFAKNYPKFVWSEACARRGVAFGLRHYQVVGAPWVYLLDMAGQEKWEAGSPDREGTIVYPFHGWEGQQVLGSHAAYIEEIKETEGDVPITVCLHVNEFENDEVRAVYEQAGVRVISHGKRGYLWQGTDTEFLYKQLAELRAHKRMISNRMSSAVMYAATTGAEVGIYGDPMVLEGDHAVLGGVQKPWRLWPELHNVTIPREVIREVAETELGVAAKMLPEEVVDAFGWGPEFEYQESLPEDYLPRPPKARRGLLPGSPTDNPYGFPRR